MEQAIFGKLVPFITHHWALCLAFVAVLVIIFIHERLDQQKRAKELSPTDVINMVNHEKAVVFDLRETEIFNAGHIIDAIRVSADDFDKKSMEKYKNKPLIFVCARGLQSTTLAAKLRLNGFSQPLVLAGGFAAWQAANLPVVKNK